MNPFSRLLRSMFGAGTSAQGQALLQGVFPSGTPPKRGTKELLDAYSTHPWLHSVTQRIGENVSGANWLLFRTGSGGPRQRSVKRDARSGSFDATEATQVKSHPFLDVLRRPNPALMRMPFWSALQGFLEIKGEVPIVIERAVDGKPLELWPVPPHWLKATPSALNPNYQFSYGGWIRDVKESDVLYLSHPDLVNPYGRGRGTAESLADEIDIDEFAAKHVAAFFFNRGLPDVFVSMVGVRDSKIAEAFETSIRNKYRGSARAWQAHVTNADLKVTTVSQNFKDSQLSELRTLQRDTILQVFGVPPEVMGIVENSNRSTIGAADFLFASKVLVPRLDFLADALSELAQEWDEKLFVAYESPVSEDADFELKVMSAQPTLFTKNEWRKLAGKKPREGWDEEFPEASQSFGAALPANGLPEEEVDDDLPKGAGNDPSPNADGDEEKAKALPAANGQEAQNVRRLIAG